MRQNGASYKAGRDCTNAFVVTIPVRGDLRYAWVVVGGEEGAREEREEGEEGLRQDEKKNKNGV